MLGKILKHALFWPVTGPQYLIDFSMDKVHGVVRDELTDDTKIKAELLELQLMLELGDIDDAEYDRREAALMQRLREVRDWRERFGMGVAGGLVQVAAEPEEPTSAEAAEDAEERLTAGTGEARGGVADPSGANVDVHLGWDDEPE